MEMESRIIFEGPGPFDLPVAQQATAHGYTNNGVSLTLYCKVPAHNEEQAAIRSKEPEPIQVQMASVVAEELAAGLLAAARDGAPRKRHRPLKITPAPGGYVLENSSSETLTVSAQELAELVRDGHRAIDPNARFGFHPTMGVEDVIVGIDAHHTQAILRLVHEGGKETAFAVPGPGARKLAQAFAAKADLIEAARAKKTEH